MAPKAGKADKKQQAAKQKVAEDKTFGLKNKSKSSKVQKYVQTVTKQVTHDPRAAAEATRKDKKKQEEERQKELNALFAVAIKQPKVPAGVDPKSVVCEFFRHGQCTKGFKCKYSHDLGVERKGHKIDLFTDQRTAETEGEEGGMEDWDQAELEKVIADKHAADNRNRPTEIVCKFFLDAVERRVYGWFWKCPNGAECKYRHALPPGYVLKSQMKELLEEEARNRMDIADVIEEERSKVDARTPMTRQVFLNWRQSKVVEKERLAEEAEADRKRRGILNGREMFLQEGFVVVDDAGATEEYSREAGQEEEMAAEAAMHAAAVQQAAMARAAAAAAEAATPDAAGPSTSAAASSSAGAGPTSAAAAAAGPSSSTLELLEGDKHLFLGDDDDDDEEMVEDDEEGEEEDDLDALEAAVKAAHVTS